MITLILVHSCKNEVLVEEENVSEFEEAYFEDYKSPLLKWGFIDKAGNFKIEAIYDDVRYFNNGLACVSKRGKWGAIDQKNKTIIEFNYLNMDDFSEEKSLVQGFDLNRYYINIKGDTLFPCPYDECYAFKNNMARYKENEVYGFINSKGEALKEMRYSFASNFKSGFAVVGIGKLYGVIDTLGNIIVDIQYDRVKINEGIALLQKDKFWTFYDLADGEEIAGKYENAKVFMDGIAIVKMDEELGYIRKNGSFIKLAGDKAIYLNENRIALKNDSGYSIVQLDGSPINQYIYKNVFKFYCGIAGMERNGLWGYVDLNGNEVLPPQLPLIWDCSDGRIRVINPSGFSYLNTKMEEVIPPQFIESRDLIEGLAPAQPTTMD